MTKPRSPRLRGPTGATVKAHPTAHPPVGAGFVVSAPSSGQGKTAVTLGLLRALKRRGVAIASAKSGPDYIDPAFHAAATGSDCLTLDSWAMASETIRAKACAAGSDLLVIEGAMGLFDGPVGVEPHNRVVSGSTAHLAASLGLPVVLVLDARRMGQTAGAIVAGLNAWSSDVRIAGILLNRVASARHEAMLRHAVEQVCPVLGVLPDDPRLAMPARHLGLVQASEMPELEAFLNGAADVIAEACELEALQNLASSPRTGHSQTRLAPLGQRIAIARDVAFAFCYPHLLQDWRALGAEISFFSPLKDQSPTPDCDAVYLPGGYPELHAGTLSGNCRFLNGLRDFAKRGALIYGECGGFMVLGQALIDADGVSHRMAGLLQLETSFAERKRHLGYRMLTPRAGPWQDQLAAHEFHYSTILRAEGQPMFKATDASGSVLPDMGLVQGNVMGSYAHIIAPAPVT